MKPIPTRYNGVIFRSRLEARWAVFFDCSGILWKYETETVVSSKFIYVPDFFLPDQSTFAEVKPVWPTKLELHKMRQAAKKYPVLLLIGPPTFTYYWMLVHTWPKTQNECDVRLSWDPIEGWERGGLDVGGKGITYSPKYHRAVEKAMTFRFDGYDQDRFEIKNRYS